MTDPVDLDSNSKLDTSVPEAEAPVPETGTPAYDPELAAVEERAAGEKSVDDLATLYDEGAPPKPPAPPRSGEGTSPEPEEEEALDGKMTFLEHLEELRKRILYSALAVAVTFAASFVYHEAIFEFLALPIRGVVDELVFTKPTEPFSIYMKVSFVAGIFFAAPIVLIQVWFFIAPGLYRREKIYAIPFIVSSTVLFLTGGLFAYYIILPTALQFLIKEFGRAFRPMVSAIEYFDFEVIILVGMGLIFQLPVLVAFLSIFGFVTPRFLWKNFRYAFLAIVVVAAVVSPTADVLNLLLWSGPMVLLYIISIGVSWIFARRRAARLRE